MNQLHSKVYELVGEASMCWSETPTGIFDTERAKLIADRFVLELEKLEKVVEAARVLELDVAKPYMHTLKNYGHLKQALKELEGGEK